MNGGRQIGEKLSRGERVARQLNLVLTNIYSSAGVDGDIVNVDVAGGIANARDVQTIATLMNCVRLKSVFEAPKLIKAA